MSQLEKTLAHYAVMRSLERSPQTFKQLLESCHSLFPDQLASLLHEMEKNHFVQRDGEEYTLDISVSNRWRKVHADWNENLDRAYTALSAIMGRIHLPHCLDYEWCGSRMAAWKGLWSFCFIVTRYQYRNPWSS